MSILPLESKRWADMKTFGGSGARVPALLREIADSRVFATAFDDLKVQVYHQYSCCEATFAVVPHLVAIGVAMGPELLEDDAESLWTFIGHIASTHDIIETHAPSDLLPDFRSALAEAESCCVALLRRSGFDDVSLYYLSLAAIGMAGHPLGMLVMDHMYPREEAESVAICVDCRNQFSVSVNDEGIFTNDDVGIPESAGQARLSQRPSVPSACRSSNPWKDLVGDLRSFIDTVDSSDVRRRCAAAGLSAAEDGVTRTTSGTAAFGLLGDLMGAAGFLSAASRYLHACDQVTCPQCGWEFAFAERWWGMLDPRRSVFAVFDS